MSSTAKFRHRWGMMLFLLVVGAGVSFFALRWRQTTRQVDLVERDASRIARDTQAICAQLNLELCAAPTGVDVAVEQHDNWLCEMNVEHLFDGCVGARGRDLVARYARLYYVDAPASPDALEKRAVDKAALRREMQAALDVVVAELSKQLGPE